jgi:hypothetical protein
MNGNSMHLTRSQSRFRRDRLPHPEDCFARTGLKLSGLG